MGCGRPGTRQTIRGEGPAWQAGVTPAKWGSFGVGYAGLVGSREIITPVSGDNKGIPEMVSVTASKLLIEQAF